MTASVSVPAGTAVGSYPVTLEATTEGTSATEIVSFTLNVTANPNFVLSEPSAFPEVNVGGTGVSGLISITSQDGFDATVTLSCSTTYGAGSCSLSPGSVNSYPATATLTINGTSFAVGSYSITVTGTSGSITHSVTVPFNVGDYSLSGTQTLSLLPGGQGLASFQLVSLNLYSGNINATCDASALAGTMCVLSPVNPVTVTSGGSASFTATVNVPNNAIPGNYNVNINTQDATGAPSHSLTVALTVAQDFTLTSSTPTQTVTAGQQSGAYQLTIQPVGSTYTAAVTLSCTTGLPVQAQCVFNPSSAQTPGNSAVDAVMNISTTLASGSQLRPFRVATLAAALYAPWLLLPGMAIGWIVVGTRGPTRKRGGLGLRLLLVLLTWFLPSCSGVSNGGGGTTGTPVTYNVTVTGTSGSLSHSTQVTLIVN
jgi:hypothetical protein